MLKKGDLFIRDPNIPPVLVNRPLGVLGVTGVWRDNVEFGDGKARSMGSCIKVGEAK